MQNKGPEIPEIDQQAVVQGTVIVRYNSAEEHFLSKESSMDM